MRKEKNDKKPDEALLPAQEERSMLCGLFDSIAEPVFLIDPAGTIIEANKAFGVRFAGNAQPLQGSRVYDFFSPEQAAQWKERVEEVLRTDRSCSLDDERDGKSYRYTLYPASSLDATFNRVLMIARDVTDVKRSELLLKNEQAYSKAIIDAFPGAFALIDANGKLRAWNSFLRDEIIGKPESEMLGSDAMESFHPEDLPRIAAKIESIMQSGVEETDEGRVFLRGGPEYQWRILSGRRIVIDGKPSVVGFSVDITERKRLEALTAFRLRLIQMAESVSVEELLQMTLDEAERLTESTIGFCQFFRDAQSIFSLQVCSSNTQKHVQSSDADREHPLLSEAGFWEEAIRERKVVINNNFDTAESRSTRPGTHPSIPRTLVFPVMNGEMVMAIFGVVNKPYPYNEADVSVVSALADLVCDIVARKRAELSEQNTESVLMQAQKMALVGQLAGGIAHDFNNMLGIILGNVEMAMEKQVFEAPAKQNLENILKATERSADLIRQLLAFARTQTVMPIVLELNSMVEGMLTMLRRLIGVNITLVWIPGSQRALIKIDPSQIDQILVNLSVNSRDAISGIGTITIETGRVHVDAADVAAGHPCKIVGDYATLSVSDNGCGIEKKHFPYIFEPFFTTKEERKGTGLGLSTVYGIAKQNKGGLEFQSEVGVGTTFRIYLPLHNGDDYFSQPEPPTPSGSYGKELILLVEDEPDILSLYKHMLQHHGYAVLSAATPTEAIRLLEAHCGEVHLLLTDVVLPEMNGCDLSKKLQLICPNLKTLFMSGYTNDIIARHGMLDEGVNFIQKPFSIKALLTAIQNMLKATRTEP